VPERVDRGRPWGQQYGLGAHWTTFDRLKICGAGSPCLAVTAPEANKYYPVGPPYVLHVDDWRALAPVWTEFAPRVYAQYPYLLAEMYAYCCAAAHLRLRHARLNHLMLSNVGAGDEAWRLSDPVPLGAACGSSADDRQSSVPPLLRRAQPATAPVPTFLHLCDPPPASDDDILTATTWCTPPNSTPCRRDWPPILIPGQNYRLGEWMFAKRRIPSGCRPTSAGGSLDLKIPRIKAINHLRMQSKYVGRKYSECAMCPAYSGDFRSPPSRRDVMHIIAGSSPTAATRSSRRRRRRSGGCATSCSRRATRAARRRNGNRSRTCARSSRPSTSVYVAMVQALAANRTAFVLCLATAYVNAAATRARSGCAAPPNASVRLFDLATRCDRPPGRRAAPTTRVVVVRSPQSPQSRAAAR